MSKKVEAIQRLRPNAEFVLRGDVLEWIDTIQTEPTQAEIDAEITYLESPAYEVEKWRQTFSVPTYKLEIELEERGLMATVQALIDGASRSTQIGWEKSPTVRRMSPTMLALAQHPSLALTAEDLDDIFKSADLRKL